MGPGSSAGGVVLTCDPATKQIASIQGGVNLGGVEMPDIASGLASGPASLVRVRDDARTYTTPDIDQEWFLDNGDRPLWLGYVAGVYARDGYVDHDYGCWKPAAIYPKGVTLDGSGDGYYQFSDWMDLYYINAVGGEGPCTEWSTLGTIPPAVPE